MTDIIQDTSPEGLLNLIAALKLGAGVTPSAPAPSNAEQDPTSPASNLPPGPPWMPSGSPTAPFGSLAPHISAVQAQLPSPPPPRVPSIASGAVPFPKPRPITASDDDDDDAVPAKATPTASSTPLDIKRQSSTPSAVSSSDQPGGFSLSGLMSKINQGIDGHQDMLLAMAGGLAGAPSLGVGLGRAFTAAAAAGPLDQKRQSQNLTVDFLQRKGMDADSAKAIASNPTLLQATLTSMNKAPIALASGSRLVDSTGKELVAAKDPDAYALTKMDDGSLVATNKTNPNDTHVVRQGAPFRPITPEERMSFGIPATVGAAMGPDGKPIAIGGAGATVNMPSPEKARDQEIGKAQGGAIGADITAGQTGNKRLQSLAILDQASKAGGDDLSSGPFAKSVLSLKQGLSEMTGRDVTGMAPTEVVQKIGFDLATQAVKAISNRPSQTEFVKGLENVPGIFMSSPGRQAMTSILTQEARADIELGKLANKKENWDDWPAIKQEYYEQHPLISPFTGKPFGQKDIDLLVKKAPADQQVKPVQAAADQVPRVAPDGKTYIPDPNRPGKYLMQVQ